MPAAGANNSVRLALGAINGAINLDVALSAAERDGQVRILSNPKVTTQNNVPAEMTQGTQIPIQTVANNTVTVQFVGESPGAKQGGVVQQVTRELRVEALPTAIPEHVEADISALEVGGTVRGADLTAIEGVAYLDDPETVLANCSIPRGITELEEAEAAEGEEGEEGEAAEGAEGEPSAEAAGEGSEPDSE